MNQAWSETGDRYILKLFRDFVFHAVGFDGEPIVDMAHIIQCLNKVWTRQRHTHTLDWALLLSFAVRCWLTWQDLFDITRWTKRDHRELFRITSSLRTGLYRIDELWSSRIFMNARRVLFKAHYSSFCLPASVYKDISQVSLFHCSTFLSCIKKIHMLFFSFFNVVVC